MRLTTAKYYTPSHKVIHERGITPDIIVPMTEPEELDLYRKRTLGAMQQMDDKERERLENTHDLQMERAVDVLKGVLLYSQRNNPAPSKVAAK